MCIYVLTENDDPSLPFVTEAGSFYMNGTSRFLATVAEENKGETRNTCNAYGYESVALIPVRLQDGILGLIHLADRREDMVPLDMVKTIERVAASLGASIRRVMAEEEIAEINRRLILSQSIFHVGSWEYNLETKEIWGSDEAVRVYRLQPSGGKFPIDEIEACIPERERVHQALIDLIEQDREYNLVFAINPADGTEQRIIASYAQLIKDEKGKPVKVAGVIQDITERKRAEDKLLNSERKLETMLQTMVDGMVTADPDGQITYANQAAKKILDIGEDILGTFYQSRDWRQVDEEGKPYPLDQLPLAIAMREQRTVANIEHQIVASNEETKWLSVNAAPLFEETGRLLGGIASFRDIT